jgi:signal transduction histidine kinase
MKLRRISLSQRVVMGTVLVSLFVALVLGYTVRQFSHLVAAHADLRTADRVLLVGSEVQDDLLELVQAQETFDQYLSEQTWRRYFEFNHRLETLLDHAKDTRALRRKARDIEQLDKARLAIADILRNATYTIDPNFPVGSVSPATLTNIREARSRLHKRLKTLLVRERAGRLRLEDMLRAQMESLRQTMIVVALLVLVAGVVFAAYLNRAAMSPLRNLLEGMRHVEVQAPPVQVEPAGAPEMRDLINAYNQMNAVIGRQQARLEAMFSLAVTVAHEVRNPIAAIGTAVQALEAGYPTGAPDREICQEILREVYRINATISDLLVFARPRPLALETIVWQDLFGEIRILLGPTLEGKQVRWDFTIDPGSREWWADRDQFHRAMLNLLSNALDVVPVGGRIMSRVNPASEDQVLITVEDSGPGVPEPDRLNIFKPFFTTRPKGTGLGLAIVTDIVERHGGTISVDASPDLGGARFRMALPRMRRSEGDGQARPRLDPAEPQARENPVAPNGSLAQGKQADRQDVGSACLPPRMAAPNASLAQGKQAPRSG